MTDTTVNGLIFFLLGLTFITLTTKAKTVGMIAVVPALVLAFHFGDWTSVGFAALAIFLGATAVMDFRA